MGKPRTLDHDEIIRRAKLGHRIVDIAADMNQQAPSVGRVVQDARKRGEIPPLREDKSKLPMKMGVKTGRIIETLTNKLTNEEWEWLMSKVDRENTTMAHVLAEAVIIAAEADA